MYKTETELFKTEVFTNHIQKQLLHNHGDYRFKKTLSQIS